MIYIFFYALCAILIAHMASDIHQTRHTAARMEELYNDAAEREQAYFEQIAVLADRLSLLEESTETDALRKDIDGLCQRFETLENAVLPDDSSARKAKEQIDAFNAGIYNILSYHGMKREENTDEEDENDA